MNNSINEVVEHLEKSLVEIIEILEMHNKNFKDLKLKVLNLENKIRFIEEKIRGE